MRNTIKLLFILLSITAFSQQASKIKKDIEIASKFAEKSNVYLEIAKIFYRINNLQQTKFFLDKSKTAAKSKDQEFWIVRELINIAEFENSIQESNASNKTLMDAKEYVLKNLDERIFIELIIFSCIFC